MLPKANQTKPDPVSSTLMNEILLELKPTLPPGITYLGPRKIEEVLYFEFGTDNYLSRIIYDESVGTFVPVPSNNPNNYNWNVSLKELIFNKQGYLIVLKDYLINTMNLVSQKHNGYYVKGFKFNGNEISLVFSFAPDPKLADAPIEVTENIKVTDKNQIKIIHALRTLMESSLTDTFGNNEDKHSNTHSITFLSSQLVSFEQGDKKREMDKLPILFFNTKAPNPIFKPDQVIAKSIIDFNLNISKVVNARMTQYFK